MSQRYFSNSNARLKSGMDDVQAVWTDSIGRAFVPMNESIFSSTVQINQLMDDSEKTVQAIEIEYNNNKNGIDSTITKLLSEIRDLGD
ncbi:MAG: hypothetical protein FWH03_05305 [Firmicutes bacterium]|nr:hypothetical protein [Bacillota bacterium]